MKMTTGDERRDRATRLAAVVLAAFVLALFLAASAMLLTGCHVGWPCDNHGGVKWTNGKLYECNDGTWE
jgi:hypothetical protein